MMKLKHKSTRLVFHQIIIDSFHVGDTHWWHFILGRSVWGKRLHPLFLSVHFWERPVWPAGTVHFHTSSTLIYCHQHGWNVKDCSKRNLNVQNWETVKGQFCTSVFRTTCHQLNDSNSFRWHFCSMTHQLWLIRLCFLRVIWVESSKMSHDQPSFFRVGSIISL